MESDLTAVWAVLLAAALVLLLAPVGARLLRSSGVLDVPTSRSSHTRPTVRGIGVVQLASMCIAFGVLGTAPVPIIVSAVGFSLLGFFDDVLTLSPRFRLIVQSLLAACTIWLLVGSSTALNWWSLALVPIGMLLLVATVNATNFMDGINGLSISHGAVWGITYGYFFFIMGQPKWATASLVMAGVSLGLLPWNWGSRARVFLGDSGSYLLGAVTATLILQLVLLNVSPIVALGPLAIYAADTGQTLLRRRKGQVSLTQAHREHVYQRLATSPSKHPRVSLTVILFTAVCCLASGLQLMDVIPSMAAILIIGASATIYLGLPNMFGAHGFDQETR